MYSVEKIILRNNLLRNFVEKVRLTFNNLGLRVHSQFPLFTVFLFFLAYTSRFSTSDVFWRMNKSGETYIIVGFSFFSKDRKLSLFGFNIRLFSDCFDLCFLRKNFVFDFPCVLNLKFAISDF